MSSFEPESTNIALADERTIRLQNEYTDAQILCEARRRGLFLRVEAETLVPLRHVEQGLTLEYQVERTFRQAAHEMAAGCIRRGLIPMGMKVDAVKPELYPYNEIHRRVRFAINFVVEHKVAKP